MSKTLYTQSETTPDGSDSSLAGRLSALRTTARELFDDPSRRAASALPGSCWFLPGGDVLALPRSHGDSRYPYGRDGFNFWVYASGYMHANEGLLSIIQRASNGQEPQVAFFTGLPNKHGSYDVVSLLPVPHLAGPSTRKILRYTIFSREAAYFITEVDGLFFGLRTFVTRDKHISFSLHLQNQSNQMRSFFVSSYLNPFLRHQLHATDEDNWFKEIQRLDTVPAGKGLCPFRVTVHEDKDRHTTTTNLALLRRAFSADPGVRLARMEETTSRHGYVGGSLSSLHTPASLGQGTFGTPRHRCTFTENAIAGALLHIEAKGGAAARYDSVLSIHEDAATLRQALEEPLGHAALDEERTRQEDGEAARHAPLSARVEGARDERLSAEAFNAFFEHLKKQVEFCSFIKGYVQLSKNSLVGVRDVFQALEGLLLWQPDATRAKMLEALSFTAPDGRCFRQYSLPSRNGQTGRMDLRPFIDQGVWVISTVSTYLRVTGDRAFLDATCHYHAILDEAAGKVAPTEETGTVLEHLLCIMDYLLRHRDEATGCILALYGDWNDALDGLGIRLDGLPGYGTGVSVMTTLQVFQNLAEMTAILERVDAGRYAQELQRYREAAEDIEHGLLAHAMVRNEAGDQRILHGWGDRRSYLVGSYRDSDGKARDGLTSNAFWVLSGLLTRHPETQGMVLQALDRLDSKYGYRTFCPAFDEGAPGVGRIPKLPPGTAENGACYVHATAFAIMALFQIGRPAQAWEQLVKILPWTALHENLSHSPFVMPNAYGFNPDKHIDGQSMNDWQTGSANVVLKLLVRFVFGYEPMEDGVWIQPAGACPFRAFTFTIRPRDCDVTIAYRDTGAAGKRTFSVNGEARQGERSKMMNLDRLWIPYEAFGRKLDIAVQD